MKISQYIRLSAALVLAAAPAAHAQGATHLTPEQVLRGYEQVRGFSGAVLVARHDSVLVERATEMAERAFAAPNRTDTRFEIASISKAFAAAAVLRLAADGRVDLQAPLSRYLPDLPRPAGGEPWAGRVTLHQLLTHTAGLPREHDFRTWETLTVAEQVRRVAALPLVAEPGAGYQYSNPGYVLLGGVVERVSGMPYERFVQTRLLGPAGLTRTGFFRGRGVVPEAAIGYKVGRAGLESTPRARHLGIYAPGGMYSTARDLYRFTRELEGGTLLPPRSAALLFQVHATEESPSAQVGYGWQLREREGRRYRLASGSADGSKSTVMREPTTGLSIVILSNSGDTPVLEMLRDLTAAAEGRPVAPPEPCTAPASLAASLGEYDFSASPLAQVMSTPGLRMTLLQEGGRAYLYDPSEDTANLLCDRGDGWLGFSFTREIRLRAEPGHLHFEWGDKTYRGMRTNTEAQR